MAAARRTPWTTPAVARLALVTMLALVVGAGCSSGDNTTAKSTESSAAAPTTVAPTTTTTISGPTTTTAPPGPSEASPTPREAIEKFVAAWQAGDRTAAARVARTAAISAVFAQSEQGFALYGCDSAEFDTSTCNYRNRASGGYAQITAAKTPQGWVVDTAFLSADG